MEQSRVGTPAEAHGEEVRIDEVMVDEPMVRSPTLFYLSYSLI